MNEKIEIDISREYMVVNVEAVECKARDNESKEENVPLHKAPRSMQDARSRT